MNKTEFIAAVADKMDCSKTEAAKFVDVLFDSLTDAIAKHGMVRFVGFGTFKVTKRAAKQVRNPQNGQLITVPESMVPKFLPGKTLKEAVQVYK